MFCLIYSDRMTSLIEAHKTNILNAIPYMREIKRKNVQTSGFTGRMYAVGLRSGYDGMKQCYGIDFVSG